MILVISRLRKQWQEVQGTRDGYCCFVGMLESPASSCCCCCCPVLGCWFVAVEGSPLPFSVSPPQHVSSGEDSDVAVAADLCSSGIPSANKVRVDRDGRGCDETPRCRDLWLLGGNPCQNRSSNDV